MSRRIEKHASAPRAWHMKTLAFRVRNLVTSLAIPTVLAACAPAPHHAPVASSAGAETAGRTVLFVGPKAGEAEAKAEPATPPAKDGKGDNTQAAVSPANQYIPLPSDVVIFEKILAKYHTAPELQPPAPEQQPTVEKKPLAAAAKRRQPQVAVSLKAPVAAKSMKDGLWDRVRRRLMLTAFEQDSVLAEVEKIRRSPGAVNFLSKRAEPFLYYIVDEIDRRGLPMDLAMVPMVESAFQANAVSPKQAAGIWQFIPGTATNYGLRLDDGYDGRYDVYASTKAALKYLSHLRGLFGGDWLLALAAYNAGEGAVQRAIQANQKAGLGTSFWDLSLPAETKAYVPKILALSRVIADPAAHGVSLRKISSLTYLARVEVNSTVPLAQAVTDAGMSWEEFAGLNPAFKPDVAPAPPFNVLLPQDKAQLLVASLQGAKLIAARKYVVKKGETLVVIAKREGVPTLKLAEWNGLQADSRVKPGQELIIYPV
ncbi:MAG: transglycosylase SLT domain-containing protein [Candidatus Methylumidiphilus sp.]